MERITGPLAEALARHREACNDKFAAATRKGGELDATAFLEHLAATVDPIVRSVAGLFAERAEMAAIALYDLSLELFTAGLLGPAAKIPWVLEAWQHLLPVLSRLMAREPRRLAGCISNALVNIAATPGARPASWIDWMRAVGPLCADLSALVECGKVLAWRAGMAQYRRGALAAASGLSPNLAGMALGCAGEPSAEQLRQLIQRLEQDPWIKPEEALQATPPPQSIRLVAKAGAFRGFGGPFLRPPTVSCDQEGLIASDGEGRWRVLADACGVVLLRDSRMAKVIERVEFKIDKSGNVSWQDELAPFPEFQAPVSHAGDGRTFAITIATSHHVFLIAKSAWSL